MSTSGITYGIRGSTANPYGWAVYGESTVPNAPLGSSSGAILGRSMSGIGVRGESMASSSANGIGVYGLSSGMFGYGVYGKASGPASTGVYGSGSDYGLYGVATNTGPMGTGVLGDGAMYGVYGTARSPMGPSYGVYGYSTVTSGIFPTYGVAGQVSHAKGYGVYGANDNPSGYGVYSNGNAYVSGTLTVSGPMTGTNAAFAGAVAIGTAVDPSRSLYVYTSATNASPEFGSYNTGYYNVTSTGTYYNTGQHVSAVPVIAGGVSNTGYVYGQWASVLRSQTGDGGTLSTLIGQLINYGHYNGVATARVTNNAYGLFLSPYAQNGTINTMYDLYLGSTVTGGTVGKHYAVYQGDANATNYLNGWTGIKVVSPTAQLEVAGTVSATRFVGDGSGLTGIAGGSSNEIASGTTKVSTNSNGYISLTTGGVTTGYFNTSGQLIAPGLGIGMSPGTD